MKNILITGGAGFIGSRLASKLFAEGCSVTVLDNLSPQIHGDQSVLLQSIEGKVRFIRGDVRNRSDWEVALEGQDAVVHLAAETGTGQSMYEIERYVDVNVRGTALLLDILANKPHGIKKILVASSRSIYGEGKANCSKCGVVYPIARTDACMRAGDFNVKCPCCGKNVDTLPTDEESKIHPSSIYGITKQNQEQMFLTAGAALEIPAVALRYQNVYGPGQSLSNPYTGILSIFSTRIRNGNDINIFEDGEESRDFVYIDDVINATVMALFSDAANYDVFNVGSGVPTDVATVAQTLLAAYGASVKVNVSGNYRLGDIRHNFAALAKIRDRLDFVPTISFEEGIARFASWVLTQSTAKDTYEQSLKEMARRGLFN
jgi:dTDP-L-rhamnose 4-epimerase